jgi:hypothetical protein
MNQQYDDQELLSTGTSERSRVHQERETFDMEALADKISGIARPYVQEALVMQTRNAAAEAWNEEAIQALKMLLSENQTDIPDDGVIEQLEAALKSPSEPDEEEICEHADEVGDIMAPAWLQYLSFALESREKLILDRHLLPRNDERVEPNFSEAFWNSLNSFAIGWETAPRIMAELCEDLFAGSDGIDLPLDILIDKEAGGASYIARLA